MAVQISIISGAIRNINGGGRKKRGFWRTLSYLLRGFCSSFP